MKLKGKILVKQTMQEEAVGAWSRPEGFDLACTCIHFPMMRIALNVAFGPFDQFKKFLKKEFDQDTEHESADAMAISFKYEKTQWHWVNIQKNDWTAEHYGTICHELHHFTHFALGESGIQYGTAGEELFAYMQGRAMELLIRAFIMLKKQEEKQEKRKKKVK